MILATELPGRLAQTQQLTTVLTYWSIDPEGTYGYVGLMQARTERPGPGWKQVQGTGVQVTRITLSESAEQQVLVTILHGAAFWPSMTMAEVLVDSPDDVQDFLAQYAPEVMERYEAWERGELIEGGE